MERNPYRKRITILVDLLNDIIHMGSLSRKEIAELLQKTYKKYKLAPIKGKATPPDLYDKEIASLYVIGKYGLGLDEEYPDLFSKIFYIEQEFEKALNYIMLGEYEEARKILKSLSPSNVVDSNTVARMLRIPLTKLLFGFMSEEEFAKILKTVLDAIPEEERTIRNYVRFYIAYKTAEEIYKGSIRNKQYKEAYKRALALRLGFPKTVPNDDYVAIIAKEVFHVPEHVLEKILSLKEGSSEKKEATGQSS
ncbi:MAG: DUF2192 domain-containing protein [Thermoprotei archaeon]